MARRTSISTVGWMLRGAAAGAAGTTALNVVTYLDMALRGRPASSTPQRTVEQLAQTAHVSIPGEGDKRASRLDGLGALTGLVAGIGVGGLFGLARAAGFRAGTLLTTAAVLVSNQRPTALLGTPPPPTWPPTRWSSVLAPPPHAAAV